VREVTQERIWNERLGWLAADGTIEREAGIKKEPPMTTDELCRRFRIRKTSIFGLWRDLRKDLNPADDCQSFAWTVLILETGGKLQALKAMLTLRAVVWRCWSPQNGLIPRHAALCYRGQWIDSTTRYWRADASPHRRAYPAGLPVLIGLAVAANMWGFF